eukprot:CAMPEP_0198143724 /NCGR_PEP_ID=MMETSP1443-20131203/9954_1 /TAXON_ID=186043 /ORGANISM="Entomoneis sp., Strain CCMP2396" /LENGTH=114 /DNA_ID=CAMNT_0043807005 /DNA_START=55 /DNA_END=399 /DNA_ORIENTATION=-
MVFTGKAVLPLLILFGSIMAATLYVRKRGGEMSQANLVRMPIIGEINKVNREGPWPECVGISFKECSKLIESYTQEFAEIEIYDEGEEPKGFNPKRVALKVDESGIVTTIPHKG